MSLVSRHAVQQAPQPGGHRRLYPWCGQNRTENCMNRRLQFSKACKSFVYSVTQFRAAFRFGG